jgi:hypothetical protein
MLRSPTQRLDFAVVRKAQMERDGRGDEWQSEREREREMEREIGRGEGNVVRAGIVNEKIMRELREHPPVVPARASRLRTCVCSACLLARIMSACLIHRPDPPGKLTGALVDGVCACVRVCVCACVRVCVCACVRSKSRDTHAHAPVLP